MRHRIIYLLIGLWTTHAMAQQNPDGITIEISGNFHPIAFDNVEDEGDLEMYHATWYDANHQELTEAVGPGEVFWETDLGVVHDSTGDYSIIEWMAGGTDILEYRYETEFNVYIGEPFTVNVHAPEPDVTEVICTDETVVLDVPNPVAGATYTWSLTKIEGLVLPSSSSGTLMPISQTLTCTGSAIGKALYVITEERPGGGTWPKILLQAVVRPEVAIPSEHQVTNGPYCDFEVAQLSATPFLDFTNFMWYDDDDEQSEYEYLGKGRSLDLAVMPAGTHTFKFKGVDNYGCISSNFGTATLQVVSDCDEKLNYIETIGYTYRADAPATEEIASHSRSYFDDVGQMLQSQGRNQTTNQVWISQSLKDEYERPVINTLSAPSGQPSFQYKHWFVTDAEGNLYNYQKFDQPVGSSEPGTLGWYYSTNNTMEPLTPETSFPYSRSDFYEDGTGELRKSARAGEVHRIGMGHEVISGTFPVFGELNDYLNKRPQAIPGIGQDGSLKNEGVQSVGRDENGRYAISITDKSGRTVMSCRAGSPSEYVLDVPNSIISSGDPLSENFRLMTYFYILHDQPVSITGSTDFIVENLLTSEAKTAGVTFAEADGKWPAGFYRILLNNNTSSITLTYTNYFLDVSYQFYDDAGRLRASMSPNGFQQLRAKEGTDYEGEIYKENENLNPIVESPLIDLTSYQYNHQGWLLSMSEPDAGTTRYLYRKDGKIRFSQNALQARNEIDENDKGKFSYTLYDQSGRPIESGEYTGSTYSFGSLTSQVEFTNQIAYPNSDKTDWIKTHYDIPDLNLLQLPSEYSQEFVRGAVSWTENMNIKTWYSYNELGRVTWMAQKPAALDRAFVTEYKYDFLGNVLEVLNRSCIAGVLQFPFYHHYEYDADSRLSKVYTSTDGSTQKLRAGYTYYMHGPLKRIELGDGIQGIDFVYNIHGWLTQINHPEKILDPGGDSNDVFGMVLDYYESAVSNLFQTAMNPSAPNPQEYHRLIDDQIKPDNAFTLGSRVALRMAKSEWRNSIKAIWENTTGH